MRTHLCAGMLVVLSTFGAGAEEQGLSSAQIEALLTGSVVIGEGTRQEFFESGRTLYNDRADSWVYWRVQDDRYYSRWPPQEAWVCYQVRAEQQPDRMAVVWIGSSGTRYTGEIKK